jgi:hypothetical protein
VRRQRAALKRYLRSGETSIGEVLCDPPEFAATARLSDLLLAVPGYGEARVRHLLEKSRISPMRTVGALSRRQREELSRLIG